MGHLLGLVIPLALGAAISPTVIALQLLMLSRKDAPLRRAWAVAAGCAVVLAVFTVIALLVAGSTGHPHSRSEASGIVKLVAAGLLVVLGVRNLTRPPRPPKPEHTSAHPVQRSFLVGAALMLTNFSSIVLFFPAMHQIGISRVGFDSKAVAFVVLAVFTLLPAYGPPLLVSLLGARATPMLERLNGFFTDHRRGIGAVLCFVFAVLLAITGANALP
jgi:threonine/homoserine/homoserine lactone efflux protein